MRKFFEKWLKRDNESGASREQMKYDKFVAEARQQLLLLKKRGLGIPVFTL